jgi:hypothetical protein
VVCLTMLCVSFLLTGLIWPIWSHDIESIATVLISKINSRNILCCLMVEKVVTREKNYPVTPMHSPHHPSLFYNCVYTSQCYCHQMNYFPTTLLTLKKGFWNTLIIPDTVFSFLLLIWTKQHRKIVPFSFRFDT